VLTDHEPEVLRNLRACMHLNAAADAASPAVAAPDDLTARMATTAITDEELFDDAESADSNFDLGQMMSSEAAGVAAPSSATAADMASWDAGNMRVRLLDWADSMAHLDRPLPHDGQPAECSSARSEAADSAVGGEVPCVAPVDTFLVVLGNEVMYEVVHAQLVAAVLAHKLALGGRALLCCAVREQKVFDAFAAATHKRGLRYRALSVPAPAAGEMGGLLSHKVSDYEGGFLLMAVDHAAAPSNSWHRDDLVSVEGNM